MSETLESLQRLNALLEALIIAHEAIYDLHSRIVSSDRVTSTSRSLLAESANIVLRKAPDTSAAARSLASRWHEQSVLDPQAAARTAVKLRDELSRTEPGLRELLERQRSIAEQLRVLATDET